MDDAELDEMSTDDDSATKVNTLKNKLLFIISSLSLIIQ